MEICAAKLSVYFNVHDALVKDMTSGCGLYPNVVSIDHSSDRDDNAHNDFIDAGVKLYNDDRWSLYPGFSLEARCSVGAPVLTVRMRFINEVLNYIMYGPIMDGLSLLSSPESGPELLTANENLPEVERVGETESKNAPETQIVDNVLETAKTIGLSYINMNTDQEYETHILEHLQGITSNLQKFILPNPSDDLVPTEIPRVDVIIANTKVMIPKSSTSPDYLAVSLGCIKISNSEPEKDADNNIRKDSVVYTLNKVVLRISGVSLYSSLSNKVQTIMGSINLTITAIVAVKTEASISLSHIVLALSEGQVLALIHLLTDNLKEEPIVVLPPPKEPAKVTSSDSIPAPKRRIRSLNEANQRLSAQLTRLEEEALQEEMDHMDDKNEGFLPREDSILSLDSSIELNELPVMQEEEKTPVFHNSNIADRIHANLLFKGVTIELFREDHGYEGIQSSKEMRSKVGTVEGSIAAVSLNDLSIQAYYHNMDISAAVSISTIVVRDSRPESPHFVNFRTLLKIGEENMPAFSVLVELHNKVLRDISDIVLHIDNKQDETVMDISVSMFMGQMTILPSPWIFDLLNWATAVGTRVSEAFTEAAASVSVSAPSAASESKPTAEPANVEIAKPEDGKNETSLIPNVTVSLHMQRMAVYVCEEWTEKTAPVFLFCFGVELDAHVTPFMDIKVSLSVNDLRGLRSDSELRLLPTDMRDAIYPFGVQVDVWITDFVKNIRASVKASDLTIRLGILDAKLFLNFISNLLPKKEEEPAIEISPESSKSLDSEPKMGLLGNDSEKGLEDKLIQHKQELATKGTEEAASVKSDVMYIVANVLFEKISFILVNDAKEFELPVLQFSIDRIKVDAAMGNNLFAHVMMSFHSDYYKASQAIWEPFMESWEMGIHVKQVKDISEHDPSTHEENSEESKAMQISVDAPRVLQMNVTATLISALLETLSDFLACEGGHRRPLDSFYVSVKNSTGYSLQYRVEKDGGINEMMLLLETQKAMEEMNDRVKFASVVDVVDTYRTHCRWLELHSTAPHLRLFKQVPSSQDDVLRSRSNLVVQTDSVDILDATCGHIFPIACGLKRSNSTIYVEQFNAARKQLLLEQIEKCVSSPLPEQPNLEKIRSSYAHIWNDVPAQGQNTTLPAHPSLALLFLKKNYRKIPDRKISLRVEDFEEITCLVDRERVVYHQLRRKNGEKMDVLVHNLVIKGRKVIDITSIYSVENLTEENLSVQFVDAAQPTSAKVFNMAHRDVEYCPMNVLRNPKLIIGNYSMELGKQMLENTLAPCINIGDSDHPKYLHVKVQQKDIYDIYNREFVTTYHLIFAPVMSLMNLLPVPLEYKIYNNEKEVYQGRLTEGEEIKYNGVPLMAEKEKEATVRISVRPEGFADYSSLDESMVAFPQEKRQSAYLHETEKRTLRLSYKAIQGPSGTLSLQLYCDFWVINRTGEDIIIHEKSAKPEQSLLIPGQSLPTLTTKQYKFEKEGLLKPTMFSYLNPDSRSRAMEFKTKHSKYCSDGVTIDAIGSSTRFCMPNKNDKESDTKERVFGVTVEGAPLYFALTNIVIITPGMFISNHCDFDLSLRLGDKKKNQTTLLPARSIIIYHCPESVHKIEFSVKCEALHSDWTKPFDTAKEEQLELLDIENDDNHLLRMRAGMNGAQREVIFDFADPFNLILYKRQQEKEKSFLKLGKKDEEIQISTLLDECSRVENTGEDIRATISRIESRVAETPEEEEEEEEEDAEEDLESLHFNVNFGGVGISLVDKNPREILYMRLDSLNVELIQCESGKITMGMTLLKFQIDSNLPGSKYDVLLGSTEAGEPNEAYDPEHPDPSVLPLKPFFQFSLSMPFNPSVTVIEYLGLFMQPMTCAIDSPTLTALLGIVSELSVTIEDVGKVDGREVLSKCRSFTRANVVTGNVGKSYILADNFFLQPINIKLSYRNDPAAPLSSAILPQDPRLMPLMALLNTVINVVGNLDNATISLRSFFLTNYYSDIYSFVKKVAGFYTREVMSKFYMLVGSFNLIGNPVELVGNVTDGVKAFFTEPIEGLMKGPGAFVGGLGKGTTKLLSSTAFGLLNSVSKITSTVGDGVAALAFSDEYQADRAAGKSNLIHGAWSGVTGIFTETGAGFKEKGVLGAVTGLGKGVVGAVAKTATGAIDTVTNVVNGVKDVTHKVKVVKPLRAPRYIPLDDVLETYNTHLSEGNALLTKAKRGTGIEVTPNERYVVHCAVDNGANIVLLTTHRFVLMSPSAKILGVAPFDNLECRRKGQELHIIPKDTKQQNEVLKNVSSMVNTVTSKVDGELKLKEVDLLFESERLAAEVERYCVNVNTMTKDDVADCVRRMLPEIHSEAHSGEGEDKSENKKHAHPNLAALKVKSAQLVDKKRVEVKETGAKKKVTQYKLKVYSQGDNPASWNIFIRYAELE